MSDDVRIEHKDGIPWHEAPLPPFGHECKPQTKGWIGFDYFERCACGAGRTAPGRPWVERNETRILRGEIPPGPNPWLPSTGAAVALVAFAALHAWLFVTGHPLLAIGLQVAAMACMFALGYRRHMRSLASMRSSNAEKRAHLADIERRTQEMREGRP